MAEPARKLTGAELHAAQLDAELRHADPLTILRRARQEFGERLALVSSFGAESAVLLHMTASVDPATPVVFLDTGQLFAPTLDYRRSLAARLGLTDVRDIRPDEAELLVEDPANDLYARDPDACCTLRKVRPLDRALDGFDAWVTGRKRFHGGARMTLPVVEAELEQIKFNPLANWDRSALDAYAAEHALPAHPLVAAGFPSIGCWPCTAPAEEGADVRAGRWEGSEKTECGIHMRGKRVPGPADAGGDV